jgi:hypothetical protein
LRYAELLPRITALDKTRAFKSGDSYENLTAARARRLSAAIRELGWRIAPDPTICGGLPPWKSRKQELAFFQPLALEPSPQLPLLSGILYLTAIVCGENLGKEQLEIFRRTVAAQNPAQADWSYLHGAVARAAPGSRDRPFVAWGNRQSDCPGLERKRSCHLVRSGRLQRRYFRGTGSASSSDRARLRNRRVTGPRDRGKSLGPGGAIVLRKNSRAGERIPLRTEPFALDITRIEALSIETREVAALLSEIMTDDPDEAEKLEEPASPQGPGWLTQLESRFQAPLLTLIARHEISREDFNLLAAQHHLIPEDLLCSINTWADDTLGDFLIEEGALLQIHRELIKEPYAAA